MAQSNSTPADKALALIVGDSLGFRPGQQRGYAAGSKGNVYVLDARACSCPSHQRHGACKHQAALKALCQTYRACTQHGARVPSEVARAIARYDELAQRFHELVKSDVNDLFPGQVA